VAGASRTSGDLTAAGGAVANAAEPSSATASASTGGVATVSRRTAGALLVLVVLLWGANWPIMKVGLQSISPLSFTALRIVLALAVMTALAAVLGQLRFPDRRDIPIILSTGILAMAGLMGLVNVALQFVDAGRAAVLIYTTPLWVTPLAAVVLHERLTRVRAAGLVVGIAGVAVLFNPLGFDWDDPDVVLGNALLLIAAVGWAVQIVHVRAHTWRGTPFQLFPWQLGLAAVVVLPVALILEFGQPIDWAWPLPAIVLYTGLVATAFCYWAVITVNRALPAMTTSLLMLAVPVAGVLFSSLAFGEPLEATTVAGLALIIGGLAAVALGERATAQDPDRQSGR
jgi:drug/metabolite transporter (DMT)-like permease